MEKHILSKSTFMYGCQCPRRLHLHKYRPELKNPVDERVEFIKASGTSIGILAQQLFPGGTDASPKDTYSYQESVLKTRELIAAGETIIYEAVFQYEGVLCALDMLVKENDAWHAYEVKGSSRVHAQYIQDAALQYYVITNSGILLEDISIVHLNMQYTRTNVLDVTRLFKRHSILKEAIDLQSSIQRKIDHLKLVLMQPEPEVDIGPHCLAPYECDFTRHCWSHIPKTDSVFDLGPRAAWKLYAAGYLHLDHIPHDYKLSTAVAHQLEHYRSGEASINKEAIRNFLSDIHYPICYLDFETVWPGVPEFTNTAPFQHLPFQFSLHIQNAEGQEPEHYEFLGDGYTDPREMFVHELTSKLGTAGTILCYNITFEGSRIRELAKLFPNHEERLLALTSRLTDLMKPFQNRWYYHPEFKGSYSIKNVLPVVCPDLRYDKLVIREGNAAGMVYAQLKLQDADTAAQQRGHLLAYCKMDTLAMIRVLEWLRQQV